MDLTSPFNPTITTYLIIPLLIIIARMMDVSIGTIRLIFVARGMKLLAPLLGFFEVLIWLIAVGQILQNMTSWVNYIAYATGFALGNYMGMVIESKLALGKVILRVITKSEADDLLLALKDTNFGVTRVDAEGKYGPVQLMFMVLHRNDLPNVIGLIKEHNPHAFYSIEDIRYVNEGIFPAPHKQTGRFGWHRLKWFGKRK